MDSNGQFYKSVPRDLQGNLRFRRHVLAQAEKSAPLRAALWDACKNDIVFFICVFIWQSNPDAEGEELEIGPFITYEFQDNAVLGYVDLETGDYVPGILDAINEKRDLVIEKSRDMGASWLCLMVMLWGVIFHPNVKFLMVSRNADAVEKADDPDSLFWKIDFILDRLPGWLRRGVIRKKMSLANKSMNSYLNGQATTGKAGVGGRCTAMFIDEFSRIDEGFEILQGTADTTKCRIFNFTHIGVGNAAYEMSQRVDVLKLQMHWSMHPEKRKGLYKSTDEGNIEIIDRTFQFPATYTFVQDGTPGGPFPRIRSPWYDAECLRRKSKRHVAMDLDIDPTGASYQFFDPVAIHLLKHEYGREPIWQGDISYDRETGRADILVPSPAGPLKLWVNPTLEGKIVPGVFTLGGDISNGVGKTPTCFTIFDVVSGRKVGEYTNYTMKPDKVAFPAVALAWMFADQEGMGARMIWEAQGPGSAFGITILELGYRNIYYRKDDFTLSKKESDRPGWNSSPASKNQILQDYQAALEGRLFINPSKEALNECLKFKYDKSGNIVHGEEASNDPTSTKINHGDHVIADALAYKLAKEIAGGLRKPDVTQLEEFPIGSFGWRRDKRLAKLRMQEQWS